MGPVLVRKASSALGMMRTDPLGFLRYLAGQGGVWRVYAANARDLAADSGAGGFTFEKLTVDDMELLPEPLRSGQLERVRVNRSNAAYAVYCRGSLAHIAWLVTPAAEACAPPRLLRLRADEVEITACYTFPEFRGRGTYGCSIRNLCRVAAEMGFRRVLMKTRVSNWSSRRGVEKAGLKCAGHLIHYAMPYFPARAFVLRLFRIGV